MRTRNLYTVGEKFGEWTLVKYNKDKKRWIAKCECGTEKLVFVRHLSLGNSKGCIKCAKKRAGSHMMTGTAEHKTWAGMKSRCLNKNNARYHQYGGRGISICERWNIFENFFEDMGLRPKGKSLDRIDVDGNYCKENCRWATPKEQMRNRTLNKKNRLGKSITEAAEETGIPYHTLQTRLIRGWDIDRALTLPLQDKNKSICAIARHKGMNGETVLCRIRRGWSIEKALSVPIKEKSKELSDKARLAGIDTEIVRARIKRGWTEEMALSLPCKDKSKSLSSIAKEKGMSVCAVLARVRKGWSTEKALSVPVRSKSA